MMSVDAVSVNCTYGADFQNDSTWTIVGNNITICDHENLDLSNVSITLQDNAQLILNGTNLSITQPTYIFNQIEENSKFIIFNNSNFTSAFSHINLTTNAILNVSDSFINIWSVRTYNDTQVSILNVTGQTGYVTHGNSSVTILNSEIQDIITNNNSTITITNAYDLSTIELKGTPNIAISNLSNITTTPPSFTLRTTDINLDIFGLRYYEISDGYVLSDNSDLFINFTNVSLGNVQFSDLKGDEITITNCNVSGNDNIWFNNLNIINSEIYRFDLYNYSSSNSNATFYNTTIDYFLDQNYGNIIFNDSIASTIEAVLSNLEIINSSIVTLLDIQGNINISFTNNTIEEIDISKNATLTFVGNNNVINNITIEEYGADTIITMEGNLTITSNYNYNSLNQSLNRSFLVRLNRAVAGYSVCLLENMSNTSDCYYTNTTDANGEAVVYFYFENSSDVDYLYIQYQNQSVIANVTADYLISASADVTPPSIDLGYDGNSIYGDSFSFNINSTTDRSYYNISQGSSVWSYDVAGLNSTSNTSTLTFDGIYLPTGNWNFTVTVYDKYNNTNSTIQALESNASILATLVSNDEAEAYIGGSDISFTFNITTKGHPYVKSYLTLTNGDYSFNPSRAQLNNGTNNFDVSGSGDYSGAQSATIQLIEDSALPSYINMTASQLGEIYQDVNMRLILEPYSGISAGEYTGSYGFGLDDGI